MRLWLASDGEAVLDVCRAVVLHVDKVEKTTVAGQVGVVLYAPLSCHQVLSPIFLVLHDILSQEGQVFHVALLNALFIVFMLGISLLRFRDGEELRITHRHCHIEPKQSTIDKECRSSFESLS